jgi:hypothetical protein
MARSIQAFVDEAGKEAPRKRDRLRIVIGFVIDKYRSELAAASPETAERALHALEASLLATEYIDRNANLGLVIQHWCEEIAGSGAVTSAPMTLAIDRA